LAASALFLPSAGALSKRLTIHCKFLARNVIEHRNRSPEVVLAFMVNVPWMAPSKHWSDDETCSYMAMALTIAMDISLNKLIVPSPSDPRQDIHKGKAQSDCITARKALDLDGFHDVDPSSDLGRRLLRRRERIWLALFVLERGLVTCTVLRSPELTSLAFVLREAGVLLFQSLRSSKLVMIGIGVRSLMFGTVLSYHQRY
jgi:hypothetical protein